jgi:hypothetical protein
MNLDILTMQIILEMEGASHAMPHLLSFRSVLEREQKISLLERRTACVGCPRSSGINILQQDYALNAECKAILPATALN